MINVGYIMLASLPGKAKAETPGVNSLQSMPATLQLVRFALALGHGMTGHHAKSFSDPMNNGKSPHQTANQLPANYIIPCGLTSQFNLPTMSCCCHPSHALKTTCTWFTPKKPKESCPTSLNFSQVFPQVFLSFPQLFPRTQGMDRLSPGTPASFAASSSPGASAADAPGLPPGLQEPNEETETSSWTIWIFGHIYACICVIKFLCVYIYIYIHVCVYVKPTQILGTKHNLSIFGVAITIYHHSHS